MTTRDLHGDRNHTHPHPSPQTLFPSPPIPIHFHFRPRQYLFLPHSIPVPELTAGNTSNINSDAIKEISINSNMDCIPSVYCVYTVYLRKIASGFSKLLVAVYSKTLLGKMNRHSRRSPARLYFHSRGTPATFASIPAGTPRH